MTATDPSGMPGDARDHFVRRPTVLVTAILTWARAHPEQHERTVLDLDLALRRALRALAQLGLSGASASPTAIASCWPARWRAGCDDRR